ncbi:MAG: hypothetical protein R3C10_23390 [Pirellulales bacterium]
MSEVIQGQLRNLQTAVVNHAKKYAVDKIKEAAVDLLIDQMDTFLRKLGLGDPGPLIREFGADEIGTVFQDSVNDALKLIAGAKNVWIEPSIEADTGKVVNAGLTTGVKTLFSGKPRPDFLINPKNPAPQKLANLAYR